MLIINKYLSNQTMLLGIFVLFIFSISGCATSSKYQKKLDSWVGHNINELVSSCGYPDRTFIAPNGNVVYVWARSASVYIPQTTTTSFSQSGFGNYTANSQSYGGYTGQSWCDTFFEINKKKKIINWQWKGNSCV